MNTTESINVLKGIGLLVLIFVGIYALLSLVYHKQHTGPAIEYTILYTTINGQSYEKEATAQDLNSGFVTFSDGTRVPLSTVKMKKMKVYADELTNAVFTPRQ